MAAEERTRDAQTLTRELLMNAFDDPGAIIMMAAESMDPEVIENQVYMIMEYLDRTEPKKPEEEG